MDRFFKKTGGTKGEPDVARQALASASVPPPPKAAIAISDDGGKELGENQMRCTRCMRVKDICQGYRIGRNGTVFKCKSCNRVDSRISALQLGTQEKTKKKRLLNIGQGRHVKCLQ